MNELYREDLQKAGYKDDEIWQIEIFLTSMCPASHEYVTKIFTRAKKRQSFSVIMSACENTWEAVWQHGTPERIGDVDDPNMAKNWIAFEGVYKILGMECPKTL